MAKTNAQKQRAMRQEELRELISKKGLVQQVLVDIGKIDELASIEMSDFDNIDSYVAAIGTAKDKVSMIKTAIDSRMKVVNKYLPDLKQQEIEMSVTEIKDAAELTDEELSSIAAASSAGASKKTRSKKESDSVH